MTSPERIPRLLAGSAIGVASPRRGPLSPGVVVEVSGIELVVDEGDVDVVRDVVVGGTDDDVVVDDPGAAVGTVTSATRAAAAAPRRNTDATIALAARRLRRVPRLRLALTVAF